MKVTGVVELEPAGHGAEILAVSFFVARFQSPFLKRNHDVIQDRPQKQSSNQHNPTAVKDGPTKPDHDSGHARGIPTVAIRSFGQQIIRRWLQVHRPLGRDLAKVNEPEPQKPNRAQRDETESNPVPITWFLLCPTDAAGDAGNDPRQQTMK